MYYKLVRKKISIKLVVTGVLVTYLYSILYLLQHLSWIKHKEVCSFSSHAFTIHAIKQDNTSF